MIIIISLSCLPALSKWRIPSTSVDSRSFDAILRLAGDFHNEAENDCFWERSRHAHILIVCLNFTVTFHVSVADGASSTSLPHEFSTAFIKPTSYWAWTVMYYFINYAPVIAKLKIKRLRCWAITNSSGRLPVRLSVHVCAFPNNAKLMIK